MNTVIKSMIIAVLVLIPPVLGVEFYVDPDYAGTGNGSAAYPWTSLDNSAWITINNALQTGEVTVYFSAREANTDTPERTTTPLNILRTNTSTFRFTVDGMSKYNTDDATPSWSTYTGANKFEITASYPLSTLIENRNYVTIRGFKTNSGAGGLGGQALYYWGGSHVVIENNDLSMDPAAVDGATLQYGYAHFSDTKIRGNGGGTDVVIRNNIVHDTVGECIYIGGSDNTNLPAHSNIVIEGNLIYNCGIRGEEGDCIDIKDMITNITVRNNICKNAYDLYNNSNGIRSQSAPILIEGNVIEGATRSGIHLGTVWGTHMMGNTIKNNVLVGNLNGIELQADGAHTLTNTLIANNTIYNNRQSGILVGSNAPGSIANLNIIGNIIVNNNDGVGGWGQSSHSFALNDVYGNRVNYNYPFTDQTGINGNVAIDPLFANPSLPAGPDTLYLTADDGLISAVCIGAYACTTQVSTAGDLNGDRIVNILDLNLAIADFDKTSGFNPALDSAQPFGLINILDIMVIVKNWGKNY